MHIDDTLRGQPVACPHCGQVVAVPADRQDYEPILSALREVIDRQDKHTRRLQDISMSVGALLVLAMLVAIIVACAGLPVHVMPR